MRSAELLAGFTAIILLTPGCEHRDVHAESEKSPETPSEIPDKPEKEKAAKAPQKGNSLQDIQTDELVKRREGTTDEAERLKIVQILISRIRPGTERSAVQRILGEPYKTAGNTDFYLEFPLSKVSHGDDLERYSTSLFF